MKKRRNNVSISQHPLGWAFLVLTLAFASLALAALISQNKELTARISNLETSLAAESAATGTVTE